MEVYERIKRRRKELGLSADNVADALGVSRATIYRYESADIEKLPTSIMEPLSKILHCSIPYLMGWEENTGNNDEHFSLSDTEKKIVTKYRESDDITKAMVLRALSIEEISEDKNQKKRMA